ncbi:uncharacterized protein N7496_002291 [Penicillium cataractarum]|uniref:Uncharacterized protein n=1 Tax=Penicillium cataractarum TaxID=2100454 RepID=A0A9W9SJU7_9EURO|nr:uncharacterized protein N7496_002291 [Penicillium cataractarum]KAJ5379863.1 hypothetical protein N7496_002291 [Penicillium cataractarum]
MKGWVTVVTGGGTGLGLIAARALAANGAKVYITGRRKEVLDKSASIHGSPDSLGSSEGAIIPIEMDVTSKESIQKVVEIVEREAGYVNVLVNNAGIGTGRAAAAASDGPEIYGRAMFAESIDDDFQKAYLSNCTQVYFVTAAFMPLLARAKSSPAQVPGNVINIASISGFTKWSQNSQYSYNSSKAAVIHLTRMLACELSHENIQIRVNAIAPGYFPTELTTNSLDPQNQSPWPLDAFQKEMKRVGAKASRPGTDEEFASAILNLSVNGYIWGHVMVVDGGLLLRHPSSV